MHLNYWPLPNLTEFCFTFPLSPDSELSWEHSSGQAAESEADTDEGVNDLKGNRMLSTEAKNILSDLELDSEEEDGRSLLTLTLK